jgi:hypothetical protein
MLVPAITHRVRREWISPRIRWDGASGVALNHGNLWHLDDV